MADAPLAPVPVFVDALPYTLHRCGVPTTTTTAAQFKVLDSGLSPLNPHGIPPGSSARPLGLSAWSMHGPTYVAVLQRLGVPCFVLSPPAPLGALVVLYKSRNRRVGGAWHWLLTCSGDTDVRTFVDAVNALPWLPCDLAAAGACDPPADLPHAPDSQVECLYAALRWAALDPALLPGPSVRLEAAVAADDLLTQPCLGWRDIACPGSPWAEDFGWMAVAIRAYAAAHAGAFCSADDEVEALLCAEELEGCAHGDFVNDTDSVVGDGSCIAAAASPAGRMAAVDSGARFGLAEVAKAAYAHREQSRTGLAGGCGGSDADSWPLA